MHSSSFEAWSKVAALQEGVITYRQLRAAGATDRQIYSWREQGVLQRMARGVYGVSAIGGSTGSWAQAVWAAVLGGGVDAFAWRLTAASWWQLDGVRDGQGQVAVEVAVPAGRQSRLPGVTRLASINLEDIVVTKGLRVTSVARTLRDLGTALDENRLERALECALRRRMISLKELEQQVALPHSSGERRLALVLCRRGHHPPTESDAETLFVQLCRRIKMPDPVRQYPLLVRGRRIRIDFAWVRQRIAVEIDGFEVHGRPGALDSDLRRQNRLVLGEWLILRFTWAAVMGTPAVVAEELVQAWRARSESPLFRLRPALPRGNGRL